MSPDMADPVAAAFARFPEAERAALFQTRAMILEVAADTGTGPLTETLKWGEPAYLTEATGAGSTVRLGLVAGRAAILFNCNTSLVAGFAADFPDLEVSGNRAVLLDGADPAVLGLCVARALGYHRDRRRRA